MMKKNYESPKAEMLSLTSASFLELSGNIGGSIGDFYAFDSFDTDYGKSF